MNTVQHDSYFVQGHGHTICQDYARSGFLGSGEAYAIVSDGCSGSPDTDLGARFLTLSAVRVLNTMDTLHAERFPGGVLLGNALHEASRHAGQMGLDARSLDATLWCAYTDRDMVRVVGCGDGVFASRRRGTGEWMLHSVEYARSMPYYLSYRLDASRDAAYRETQDDRRRIIDGYRYDAALSPTGVSHAADDGLTPATFELRRADVDMVLVGSDGWNSFLRGQDSPEAVPLSELASEFLAFKNTTGQFARRRWQRMERDHRKTGLWHYDDVSLGALYLPDRPEE